jgi:hypothetical protein
MAVHQFNGRSSIVHQAYRYFSCRTCFLQKVFGQPITRQSTIEAAVSSKHVDSRGGRSLLEAVVLSIVGPLILTYRMLELRKFIKDRCCFVGRFLTEALLPLF